MAEAKKSRSGSQRRRAVVINVAATPELAALVDAAAEAAGVTRSAWVRAAIEAKLGGG